MSQAHDKPMRSKQRPWIPPGKTSYINRKAAKPKQSNKRDICDTSPKRTLTVVRNEYEAVKEDDPIDAMSVSSNSSYNGQMDEPNIHLFAIFQEMKLLYVHFASLKSSYLSAHRLIDSQDIEDINIKELLRETGVYVKELNDIFDDLEFSVSVLENTLDENAKTQEYSKVFACKEQLLSKLLDMYEKVIIIFQNIFEKQDFREISQRQDSLSRKLKATERKSISQEAVIKDLERRLSIYQSKTNAMESYKTSLEMAKAEMEKQLFYKESQIKYLSDELLNLSGNRMKSEHEDFIEIIEHMKTKAHSDKSALKKAIKFQKTQLKDNEEKFQKLMQESSEKEKMLYDIASQRDQLKVQLTVINNSVIQQKNQMEEMRIQNLKQQNEVSEKDLNHKKEVNEMQSLLEEKSSLLESSIKAKKNLEKAIEELEGELEAARKQIKNLKADIEAVKAEVLPKQENTDTVYKEMQRLVSLLQNTKEIFESLKSSHAGGDHVFTSRGDSLESSMELGRAQNEILVAVKETKEHLLELKNLYKTFLQEQKESPVIAKKNDLEKKIKQLQHLYDASMQENQALKSEIEEIKSVSMSSSTVQKTENYFTATLPSDNFTKNQLELMKKNDEILKMKYEFHRKERDLESQLKEYKDKINKLEVDSVKMSNLEEELKVTKLELSHLQQKKEDETDRLLQRTKELQDSLDLKNTEFESLERYVQHLKSSYFNVFGDS